MDLSKLPKFSQTSPSPNHQENVSTPASAMLFCECGAPVPAGSRFCPGCGKKFAGAIVERTSANERPVEAYFNIAFGLLLLLMFPRFWQWFSSRLFGTSFNEFMRNNTVVPYPNVPEFWADLGPASLAVMLILDGVLAGLIGKRWALWLDTTVIAICTLYNAIHLIRTFSTQGLALMSAIAVIYGLFLGFARFQSAQKVAPTAGKTAGAQGG